MALVTALAVGAVVTLTPANGAASDIATGFVRAVRHLAAPSRAGQAFAGTPAVGALFTTSAGRLGQHFCTASVVDSPAGDLVITAAHCVADTSGTIEFVPGYDRGNQPYGVWTVTKVYVDRAWKSSSSDDDDFAFLQVSQPGSSVPVENVTGPNGWPRPGQPSADPGDRLPERHQPARHLPEPAKAADGGPTRVRL
jgi:hypothetical protein